ncbi:MAG: ATP-binding protein [Pseudomonadota bacterium]
MVTIARRSIAEDERHAEPMAESMAALSSDALLDALSEAIVRFDADERVVGANVAFRELFVGLDDLLDEAVTAETLFAALTVHLAPAVVQGAPALLDERLSRLRSPGPAWRQFLADGRIVEVEDRDLPCGGRLTCYRDVTRQVSDFSHLSQRLSAVESMEDGIAILDGRAVLDYVNPAMVQLLGFADAQSQMGRPLFDLLSRQSACQLKEDVLPALPNTHRWRGEVTALRATGEEIPLEISITQLDEGGAVVVARSLVEQKANAAERARLQAQFFGAQKMEALGTLAGSIAHDFNNMLTSIMGYATFLMDDLPLDSRQNGYARHILTAGERAQSLVAQILSFSRRGESAHRAFFPASIMRETATFLQAMLPPRIDLALHIADEDVQTAGDPTQIAQVVMNLAVNARDAMPKTGGRIDLTLVEQEPQAQTSDSALFASFGNLSALPEGSDRWLCLSVSDNGKGMSQETLDRVFEPFFTTKGDDGGTGLGLAAVQGIVVEHGGGTTIATEPGKGSTFCVYLPVHDGVS